MALPTTLIASTPTSFATARPGRRLNVHLINDDPSQTIDVTVWRTVDDAAAAARMSNEEFTQIAPGEARFGIVQADGSGVQFILKGQASGAGNAPLRYWIGE